MEKDLEELTEELERLRKENSEYKSEMQNFVKYAKALEFTQVPQMQNFDIAAKSIPYHGDVGGDHITFVDFDEKHNLEKRARKARSNGRDDVAEELVKNKNRAGMMIVDASGHKQTDAFAAKQVHNLFMNGVYDELTKNGQITTQLFENLSLRFYNSTPMSKFATLLYGEVNEDGTFKFVSAGHEPPVIFSQGKMFKVPSKAIHNIPGIGISMTRNHVDSDKYHTSLNKHEGFGVNKLKMKPGDVMMLYTDGLSEHGRNEYFPSELEEKMKGLSHLPVEQISEGIKEDVMSYSSPEDDISYILVKHE